MTVLLECCARKVFVLTTSESKVPKINKQAAPTTVEDVHSIGFWGMLMSAAGVAMMTATMLGSAAIAVIWSFGKLLGLPDWFMLPFHAAAGLVVLWVTIWATGRAWHVERLLENGKDIDVPIFKALHYWKKRSLSVALPVAMWAAHVEWLEQAVLAA